MPRHFPPIQTLSKYLALLNDALSVARSRVRPIDDDFAARLSVLRDIPRRLCESSHVDEATLEEQLTALRYGVIQARNDALRIDAQLADLLEAVHNIPELLMDWPRVREDWLRNDILGYEQKYLPNLPGRLGLILDDGPRGDWPIPDDDWLQR